MDIFTELGNPDMEPVIYTESTEERGLLISNYADLPDKVGKFMDRVETEIDNFIRDPSTDLTDLKPAIEAFKHDTKIGHIPELIDPQNVKGQLTQINAVSIDLDKLLIRLAKLRNKLAFGGNLIRGIIRRPKVYVKDYRDTESYEKTNNNQRTANRALDWIEKVLLDLFNLCDQDLNLITLVDTVYLKQHIYESGEVIVGKYDAPMTEKYTMDNLPNIMYFASPVKVTELKGKVFLTPYIGISSMFIIDRFNILRNYASKVLGVEEIRVSANIGYDEWVYPDHKLMKPLDLVHMSHNVKDLPGTTKGTSSGYIYTVDISNISKNQLSMFVTLDPDREIIYNGDEPLRITDVQEHTVDWELRFDSENVIKHGAGIIEIMESSRTDHQIRPLTDQDLDGLLSWLLKFDEFNDPADPDGSNFDRGLLINDPAGRNYSYGYFIDDKIVGLIRGHRWADEDYVALSFLFIRPDQQGQGIGDKLISFMLSKFEDYEKRLNVIIDNTRAIRLYRKYGFYTVDRVSIKHPFNPNHPDIVMYKMRKPVKIGPDDYDPPLSPDKLPAHLLNDDIHLWRAETGIELIHREPSEAELDRIWQNWERMTDRQKTLSNEISRKFFGKSNQRHLADLRAEAQFSESLASFTEAIETSTTPDSDDTSDDVEKESQPKQIDRAETPKNGVKRKELYIAFIDYAKHINPKNTFGSVFDKDAFKVTYPFVPEEMRYFYRLANPLLCVIDDKLTFFSLTELRKINNDNPIMDKRLIFAASGELTEDGQNVIIFNMTDKAIYMVNEKTIEDETLTNKLADSFDAYLEHLAGVSIL